jgi:hypothetical protein
MVVELARKRKGKLLTKPREGHRRDAFAALGIVDCPSLSFTYSREQSISL